MWHIIWTPYKNSEVLMANAKIGQKIKVLGKEVNSTSSWYEGKSVGVSENSELFSVVFQYDPNKTHVLLLSKLRWEPIRTIRKNEPTIIRYQNVLDDNKESFFMEENPIQQ